MPDDFTLSKGGPLGTKGLKNKVPSESKCQSNPMWGTLENWKLLLSLFTTVVIG